MKKQNYSSNFPKKTRRINSDDQPWVNFKFQKLDRRRKEKSRKSDKWKKLDKKFKEEVKLAKSKFYKKKVADLKNMKPGQWYSCLKKLTSFDQLKCDQPNVEEIRHLSDQAQAELIADKFAKIQNEYEPLKK